MSPLHDDLFHFTFQHPRHARAWLQFVLPTLLVQALDWRTLQRAPAKLRGYSLELQEADLVYRIRLLSSREWVWIVGEHKSYRAVRALAQVRRYASLLSQLAPDELTKLPVAVISVVFYHGDYVPVLPEDTTGTGTTDNLAAMLHTLRPTPPVFADDITRCSEEEILERPGTPLARLVWRCLGVLCYLPPEEALRALQRWADILRDVDRDPGPPSGASAISSITRYCVFNTDIPAEQLQEVLEDILQHSENTAMSTVKKHEQIGFAHGHAEGKIEGKIEGKTEGKAEGKVEGKAEGKVEGKVEGKADTLLRLAQRRFGKVTRTATARIRTATIAELDRWTDRILDAKSLNDVFRG